MNRLFNYIGILSLLTIFGCEKECIYKSLPNKNCHNDFSNVLGSYHSNGYAKLYGTNHVFIINDDSTYKQTFVNLSGILPFGEIDFSTKSLIGVNIQTNVASDFKSQGYLCKKNDSENWTLHIDYSLKDQCKGSRISRIYFTASFICNKIDSQANIKGEIVDVNPF